MNSKARERERSRALKYEEIMALFFMLLSIISVFAVFVCVGGWSVCGCVCVCGSGMLICFVSALGSHEMGRHKLPIIIIINNDNFQVLCYLLIRSALLCQKLTVVCIYRPGISANVDDVIPELMSFMHNFPILRYVLLCSFTT